MRQAEGPGSPGPFCFLADCDDAHGRLCGRGVACRVIRHRSRERIMPVGLPLRTNALAFPAKARGCKEMRLHHSSEREVWLWHEREVLVCAAN
jgi:hypothetical protein